MKQDTKALCSRKWITMLKEKFKTWGKKMLLPNMKLEPDMLALGAWTKCLCELKIIKLEIKICGLLGTL